MEYDVPDPAGDPVTIFYAARAVMVQVISLEMSEVAISKLSEVQEIVQPLFSNIALHNACKQSREGVHGKQETEWRGYEKDGQDIFELTANMPAVKRSLMVFPVKRVEPLVKKSAAGIGLFTLSGGSVSSSTNALPGGTYTVTAHYTGDGTNAASDSNAVSVAVAQESSK